MVFLIVFDSKMYFIGTVKLFLFARSRFGGGGATVTHHASPRSHRPLDFNRTAKVEANPRH